MQQMLKQAMACDYEGDALLLAKAAKIVRTTMASILMATLAMVASNSQFHLSSLPLCLCS